MRLRDWFSPGATPVQEFLDATLGTMTWSEDDESWLCSFQGRKVFIGYDRASELPLPALLEYARSILVDSAWIAEALDQAKRDYIAKHPKFEREVASLEICEITFHPHNKGDWMQWNLGEPVPDHFWLAEFRGRELIGFGFDT